MSHGKERKEKNCLNCNAIVAGRFCQVCGQENLEPDENFWQLCVHFIYDIFHFDGQFFSTLKYLLFKPAFLTKEFFKGRRASYLHPIRMYLFTSAIFFLIYFSFINHPSESIENADKIENLNTKELSKAINELKDSLAKTTDSLQQQQLQHKISILQNTINFFNEDKPENNKTSVTDTVDMGPIKFNVKDTSNENSGFTVISTKYKSIAAYDSAQAALPEDKRDGWLRKYATTKAITLNEEYQKNKSGFWEKLKENFIHSLPKMMFISLPLAALILQLLYIRKKQFKYAHHNILTVHVYTAVFILMLTNYGINGLHSLSGWRIFEWISTLINISIIFYIYKAMRNYYSSSRLKTIFKFFLLIVLYDIVILLLAALFFINSILAM